MYHARRGVICTLRLLYRSIARALVSTKSRICVGMMCSKAAYWKFRENLKTVRLSRSRIERRETFKLQLLCNSLSAGRPATLLLVNSEGDRKGPRSTLLLSRPYKDTDGLRQQYQLCLNIKYRLEKMCQFVYIAPHITTLPAARLLLSGVMRAIGRRVYEMVIGKGA